ncbi:hypothetical protein EII16_04485 [Campylobacter rectus]|nr:hypothetical protein EII16_04485 [Campylobacter rectus]
MQLRAKRSKDSLPQGENLKLIQNQRSDAAGEVSIKTLARRAVRNKAKYFCVAQDKLSGFSLINFNSF